MLDEMNNKKNVYAFNILLLGERDSGRRSLILRFTDNTFNSQNFGIPWEYKTKTLNFDDKIIHCTLWIYHPGGEALKSCINIIFKNMTVLLLLMTCLINLHLKK